jgi:hypothetical protein
MSPSIKNNQEVFISYSNIILKPGYCYAFLYGNNTVVHRFVRIKNGMAVFIGDRSRSIEIVYPNCVVGYVPLQQNIFIIQTIAFINYVFIKLFFYIKIVKLLRIACIMMLTKGAPHARKI